MYNEIASGDIALTLLILFTSLVAWILVMNILTKLKRRRKRRAIAYGIKDFMSKVRS